MDKEVLRDVWQGQLPLCFKLHPDDVSGMHRPEPYYMMVPRITYFPIVLDRVVKYFNRFMDPTKNSIEEMWLDYDGQPIKWHHPVGLSWDLFGANYDLPWRLMLHFSEFPEKNLVRCNSKAAIKTIFMSTIKEADALKHKGSVTKNMLEKDQNVLWSSLVNDKFDQFWSINKRLMDRVDNELFRSIPFRIYFADYTYIQRIMRPCTLDRSIFLNSNSTHHDQRHQQRLGQAHILPIYDKDIVINRAHKCSHSANDIEEAKTNSIEHRFTNMLDLIQSSFIDRMHDLLAIPPTTDHHLSKSVNETRLPSTEGLSSDCGDDQKLIDVTQFRYRFLSHGIEIPFDTPLQWLIVHVACNSKKGATYEEMFRRANWLNEMANWLSNA